ncbi:UNVERIFIED_CONTAM: NAD(P)/FAD-dependent oxidoreductase, partial [Salmonella enterica subsp. enterica serovar Weltevreden]
EPNPNWTRMFARQPEIKAYLQHCARKYALLPHIRFDSEVVRAEYDEAAAMWTVTTRKGEVHRANVLVSGMGGLSTPAYPTLKGLENFKGKVYHTAHWPEEAVDFSGQRVGVIGTGSSGIQVSPILAEQAKHLFVFQRTPSYSLPAYNRSLD